MIKSFKDKRAKLLFEGKRPRKLPQEILRKAATRLQAVDAAQYLEDLRLPPSNHLEALKGDRVGQHSIRINLQWRICFVWKGGDAHDVEIVDYH